MKLKRQTDIFHDYDAFVEKFKPKKTTDDCMTPDNIYSAIVRWAADEYKIDPTKIVRPFWPGGNYEEFDYPDGCIVLDNPPFSILSKIARDYIDNGIKFLLFAPSLTLFTTRNVCHLVVGVGVEYENGAVVATSFITNLDAAEVRSVPELYQRIEAASEQNQKEKSVQLPKYEYPKEVLTAAMVQRYSKYGVSFTVMPEQCHFTRALDSQRPAGKAIFGAGYLLSKKAAAEKAAAEKAAAEKAAVNRWSLSDAEKEIVRGLK
jgi:hypothetical protein